MSFNQTLETSKLEAIPVPFPSTKGTATLKILNGEQSLGPALVLLRMEPGSEIARHLQERATETLYVIDGDFINEGTSYPAGTELNVKPMIAHGPHTTKHGCSVLVMFSYPSVLDDFKLAQPFQDETWPKWEWTEYPGANGIVPAPSRTCLTARYFVSKGMTGWGWTMTETKG